ncbi:MAG: hypothetical protein RIC03_10255 [Cyclobacteriaceae bacterium]
MKLKYALGKVEYALGKLKYALGKVKGALGSLKYALGKLKYAFGKLKCALGKRNIIWLIAGMIGISLSIIRNTKVMAKELSWKVDGKLLLGRG